MSTIVSYKGNVIESFSDTTKVLQTAGTWLEGNITIQSQEIDMSTYAPLHSPAFTGTPTAPTPASGTNTTQLATTAFVQSAISMVYTFKGTKATYAEITALTSKNVGDVWYCTATNTSYVWNGSAWSEMGYSVSGFYTGTVLDTVSDISY